MPRFILMTLLICFSPFWAHAQDGAEFEQESVEVLIEEDYESIANLHKLRESIPIAEKNCYRIRKNKLECKCDNKNLYDEYDEVLAMLEERHPEWSNKSMTYNFFWEGVTYEGKENFDSFRSYVDNVDVMDCEQR